MGRWLLGILATLFICATAMPYAQAAGSQDDAGARIFQHGMGSQVKACIACHGRDGRGAMGPRLTGLSASYVMSQLQGFRQGMRKNKLMHAEVARLDAGQMQAVAQYVARLPVHKPHASGHSAMGYATQRLIVLGNFSRGIPACIRCHGADLRGGGPAIPSLVGLSSAYLARQLRAYRSGDRQDGHSSMMNRIAHGLQDKEITALASAIAKWPGTPMTMMIKDDPAKWNPSLQDPNHFSPPAEEAVPSSVQLVAMIREGEQIFTDTPHHAAMFAGNALSCANCHIDRGRDATAAPMWAALPHFPMYRKKNHRVNTIQMRIQGCFKFSENGTPPPVDSHVMNALTVYLHWLSTGMPMGVHPKAAGFPRISAPAKPADRVRGRQIFMARCAMCHGMNGEGRVLRGMQLFPPLWGPKSFNWGAGMHKLNKAASFIKFNMPYGAGGSLSDQQAWDVAAYVDSHPRPQDPRFTGDVATTTARFHKKHRIDFYGQRIDGYLLGAPGTLGAWTRQHGS